ncbi:hypothetical protein DPMN_038265 [Dreissena polymorpha]|uniref:Uncharacterized protein n=1 Tax=Dreissena polymorpha TaxID=45954 RepID=A0A9D4MGR3_DREPO|nr:hypothetical protein DPMN_038265 [Dreissena polymorpha]
MSTEPTIIYLQESEATITPGDKHLTEDALAVSALHASIADEVAAQVLTASTEDEIAAHALCDLVASSNPVDLVLSEDIVMPAFDNVAEIYEDIVIGDNKDISTLEGNENTSMCMSPTLNFSPSEHLLEWQKIAPSRQNGRVVQM